MPYIKTSVENGVLRISTDEDLRAENSMKVRISAPAIESVDASGVAKFNVSGINGDSFKAIASGASHIMASGEAKAATVDLSGASKFDGTEFTANNAFVDTSGSSRVIINASNKLTVKASGASSVRYIGEPLSVESDTSGVSSVEKK